MDIISSADIQKYLGGMNYPANKNDLMNKARENGASSEIIDALGGLPSNTYNSPNDVMRAFGKG